MNMHGMQRRCELRWDFRGALWAAEKENRGLHPLELRAHHRELQHGLKEELGIDLPAQDVRDMIAMIDLGDAIGGNGTISETFVR